MATSHDLIPQYDDIQAEKSQLVDDVPEQVSLLIFLLFGLLSSASLTHHALMISLLFKLFFLYFVLLTH